MVSLIKGWENLIPSSCTWDLIFLHGSLISTQSPWRTSIKHDFWYNSWIPNDLSEIRCRIFTIKYRIHTKNWSDQFPLLETSKILIRNMNKHNIGSNHHNTIFFACGFDSLLLKQVIYISSIEQANIFSSIRGVIFFGAIPLVKNLHTFQNMIACYSESHHIPTDRLVTSIPALLDLHHVFSNLAKSHNISCLSYGNIFPTDPLFTDTSFALIDLLSEKEYGEYYYIGEDTLNMSCFKTPEDFGYFHTIEWILHLVHGEANNIKKYNDIDDKDTSNDFISYAFTLAYRHRSVVLSKGKNTTIKLFNQIGKERTRHPSLIKRLKSSSIYPATQSILLEISKHINNLNSYTFNPCIEKSISSITDNIETLRESILSGLVELHLVGDIRKIQLVKAFICSTLQFVNSDNKGNICYPESICIHPIPIPKSLYDMDLDLLHVLYVKKLLQNWGHISKWGASAETEYYEEQLIMDKLRDYVQVPLTIAIVGRGNVGKSVFINGIISRDILPAYTDKITGCCISIRYAKDSESECAEIKFVDKCKYLRIRTSILSSLDEINDLITQEEASPFSSYSVLMEMKTVRESLVSLLSGLEEEYNEIQLLYPKGFQQWQSLECTTQHSRDKSLKKYLLQTTMTGSPIRYRLIEEATVYIHHPLLKSVSLLDTPSLSDTIHAEHIFNNRDIHGWLYLTPYMQMEDLIVQDYEQLQKWCTNGVICITKIDEALSGIDDIPIEQLLVKKRNTLGQKIFQKSFPAVSMIVLQHLSQYNKKNKRFIENHLDNLILSHIGSFLISYDNTEDTTESEYTETYYNEYFDKELLPYTKYLRGLYTSYNDYKKALFDSAKEASLLMHLLAEIYDRIDSHFIIKKFNILLGNLASHLSNKLNSLSAKLQNVAGDIQQDDNSVKKDNNQLDIELLETEVQHIKEIKEEKRNLLINFMDSQKSILYNEIISPHDKLKRGPLRRQFSKFKDSLVKRNVECCIYEKFDKPLAEEIEHYIYEIIFSPASVESLLKFFPETKDSVLVSIQGISVNHRLLIYSDDIMSYRNPDFIPLIKSMIDNHFKKISTQALDHFDKIFTIITGAANYQIRHEKGVFILQQQNSGSLAPKQPLTLLLTKLNILSSEFVQLQQLYSSVLFVFLQNRLQELQTTENKSKKYDSFEGLRKLSGVRLSIDYSSSS